ncbi:hypothetical protein RA28_10215 [Ruegeria sp. ANG-S4]|nr:hypothetical protein RA28_10215 [Ruegeria sp. ANG-S4]
MFQCHFKISVLCFNCFNARPFASVPVEKLLVFEPDNALCELLHIATTETLCGVFRNHIETMKGQILPIANVLGLYR